MTIDTLKPEKYKQNHFSRRVIFRHQDTVPDPQTPIPFESWDCQLSLCVYSIGRQNGEFLSYDARKVDLLLEVNFCQNFGILLIKN